MSDIVTKVDLANKNGLLLNTEGRFCRHPILVLPRLLPLEIRANGSYPVPNGYAGYGRIEVSVDPLQETSLVVTRNGTYQAPPGTAFTSVTVRITEESPGDHTCKYSSILIPATCTQPAIRRYTCTICGHTHDEAEAPALGHSFVHGTCTECGAADPNVTPDGDAFDFSLTIGQSFTLSYEGDRPTVDCPAFLLCTDADEGTGMLRFLAVKAGEGSLRLLRGENLIALYRVLVESVPAEGDTHTHTYTTSVTPPTCTESGYTTHTCTVCGHQFCDGETPALGHRYVSAVTEPTCTESGYTEYTCSICGHSFIGNETHALGHKYVSTVTAPTCTTEGYTTHVCSVCNHTVTDHKTPALSHKYVATVTSPTCTEEGYTTHVCSHCGHTFIDKHTDPNGHDFSDGWTVDLEPTCNDWGTKSRTCAVCGETESRTVPPISHEWSYYPDSSASSGWSRECIHCHKIEEDMPYDG